MATPATIAKLAKVVGATYSTTFDELQLRVWTDALSRYDEADVLGAVLAHIKDPDRGQYPPKPADLIKAIRTSPTGVNSGAYKPAAQALPNPKAKASQRTGHHYRVFQAWLCADAKNPQLRTSCKYTDDEVITAFRYVEKHWAKHGHPEDWHELVGSNQERLEALFEK